MATQTIQYHPVFFLLMALVAMAELGLTSFLINAGNESDTWPSTRYHKLLIFFCFNSVWTTLFATSYVLWVIDGAVHALAGIASSVAWLFLNTALWAIAAATMQYTRGGGNCSGQKTISRCRQSLTVEALGWTELGLTIVTLLATCCWVRANRRRSYVNDSRRLV
ncbi:uncharacterized protein FOMMEDRAFT_133307 [Fomitiporia mediterranea MF3/22]|uniref:uncharacterized protein n=1 Tax=Fomitiporia mediterranea (strain MF3/22) TaxID=694068 RepID=UPI0004407FF6|nr:uncharacterized protein FOMMEDRAFT_133307 [Fomitiporia mediterranea MF3/22]EJD03947.1 hypothetical protein FOMMEDRAFT_133307 [Fomitiporia mediterranea MF3/22]